MGIADVNAAAPDDRQGSSTRSLAAAAAASDSSEKNGRENRDLPFEDAEGTRTEHQSRENKTVGAAAVAAEGGGAAAASASASAVESDEDESDDDDDVGDAIAPAMDDRVVPPSPILVVANEGASGSGGGGLSSLPPPPPSLPPPSRPSFSTHAAPGAYNIPGSSDPSVATTYPGAYSVTPGERRASASSFTGSQAETQLRAGDHSGEDEGTMSTERVATGVDANDGSHGHDAAASYGNNNECSTNGAVSTTNLDSSMSNVMATATLVQDDVVVDATPLDLDAELAERDLIRRENEALREASMHSGAAAGTTKQSQKRGCNPPLTNRRPRCRIAAALAVVVAATVAIVVGVLLGRRSEGTAGNNSEARGDGGGGSVDDRARRDAVRAILAPLNGGNDAFDDEQGPRFMALDWIVRADPAQVPVDPEHAWKIRQRYVLALFYFSTGGDGWGADRNFMSGEDECKWFELLPGLGDEFYPEGVACDERGRVMIINIAWNNLSGTLPHEVSYFAESLTKIVLIGGALSGTIPSELGNLTKLQYLSLGENCLSGTVPESISALPILEMAEFPGNKDLMGSLNGFCDGTEYKGNLKHLVANCDGCPGSPMLIQCDCCVCCDIATYNCCDKEGTRLWNHANIGLNAAGQPFSFDKPCLSDDTLAYYSDNKNDTSWITDGRGEGW